MFFSLMDFTHIPGFRDGHLLLYLHNEKHLYMQTHDRSGQIEYICYEHVVPVGYRVDNNEKIKKCSAKTIKRDGRCRRNAVVHQNHPNHELIFKDLQSLNAMKLKCRSLAEWCPNSSHKISAKEIFMIELSK